MVIGAIFGAILTGLGSALGTITTATATALGHVIGFVKSVIGWFLDVAPRPLKVFTFIFFILFIANVIFGLLLSTSFTCTSGNTIRKVTFLNGVRFAIEKFFHEVDDQTLLDNSVAYNSETNRMIRVACSNGLPRPYFFNINILSFPLWILLSILIYGMPLIWRWYKMHGLIY